MSTAAEAPGGADPVAAALQRQFGFSAFRPGQEAIVRAVLAGVDVLCVMPTGAGKSLCFQLPALLRDGTALVISPLIALMKDQVEALAARGIAATFINSTLAPQELESRLWQFRAGAWQLVYVAPERLRQPGFLRAAAAARIAFVAVDEAHCVSQWGHDFRPDYLRIGAFLDAIGRPPACAFTATATPEVRADILQHLGLRQPRVFVAGFARPNLAFRVHAASQRADKLARLGEIIERQRTGIVYCATRRHVDEVASRLEKWDICHVAYHAGMPDAARAAAQDQFMRGAAEVAVATNAFGMGIDRADIRFVVHFDLPGSVEAYYQEAGRAGRDGQPALCELLYNYADRQTQDFFIDGSNPPPWVIRMVYAHLRAAANGGDTVQLSIEQIADALALRNSMQVGSALSQLAHAGAIERFDVPGARIRATRLLPPGYAPDTLPIDDAALAEKERRDRARLMSVLSYATLQGCRQAWIRRFFGESDPAPCGGCDNCRQDSGRDRDPHGFRPAPAQSSYGPAGGPYWM
jgi:ATP-dependent DNA helicase RecQ